MVLDFTQIKEKPRKIEKYYLESLNSITWVFTDKIEIDWKKLEKDVMYDSEGYIKY